MTLKALIVEDEPVNREALRKLLQSAGYAVSMAWTASGALQQLTKEKPDIVLLDIDLGEETTSGIDVARVMSSDADWCRIPIIVTSAMPTEEIRARARGDAFEGLRAMMLPKPIEAEILLRQMAAMLGVI